MRPQIVIILTVVFTGLTNTAMLAQSTGIDSGPPPPPQRTTPELPLDGWIPALIILAILYGGYIAYKRWSATDTPA
ncbi:hypothetical protein [Altibacter sp. HG106]|uniref:hypothetical protein n=1 Tax=Altibacter sp. HG106 TaxID=3023937 RepID=UPI002350F0EC|nr:hypothetical protein [Altibacter sp. HG106]MDC7994952.1 hypothetical protein [Altibacter sp. HG106]